MGTHTYLEFYKGIPNVGERSLVAQTCDGCGQLVSAKHYKRTHRNTWPRTCSQCVSRRYRERHPENDVKLAAARKKTQSESLATATNYNRAWTLSDLDELVKLREQGMVYREIAAATNRTLFAIQGAFGRFGLANGWPSRETWEISLPK
jgi:hypothetical protein